MRIDADASLAGILALAERLLDSSYSFLGKNPKPNPGALYPSGVQASMPESTQQLTSALVVQLTRADKDALDLQAAWPLCTREQLAGLMGGVTLRRVNQVLRSLSQRGLVRADGPGEHPCESFSRINAASCGRMAPCTCSPTRD